MQPEPFFDYARKRYQIHLDRTLGKPKPWTDDPILRSYRFCNIFREDDTTTAWFRMNVREPLDYFREVLLATVIFRWFNKIETGEVLLESGLFMEWNSEKARVVLKDLKPLITGAYMVKSPPGLTKLEGILQCIDKVADWSFSKASRMSERQHTLQETHRWRMEFPYLGPFMAYESVTDLRHTYLLDRAPDIMTWANAGPGAARGLERLRGLKPKELYNYNSAKDQVKMIEDMQALLQSSKDNDYWPQWEMREVEHTLCEFDKYERVRLGEGTPKQLYNGER
jgi:hypothetical protein